jgi:TonB-dependent receptor
MPVGASRGVSHQQIGGAVNQRPGGHKNGGNLMSVKRYALVSTALTGLCMMSAAQAQSTAQAPDSGDVSEIVVSGFRKSLETALESKKNDDRVIDVISAEDIGKLPAENIAEAIQRVPGVQMQNINGRGSTISIRGLSPNFVSNTVDGQDFASPGYTNGFRYDLIQPELAQGIEVVKSPSSDMDSGFLAGTVNIKTVRPLDLKEPSLVVSTKGQWSPFADNGATPKGAVSYADQFYGGKLGVYLGAAYQELNDRADYAYMDKWNYYNNDAGTTAGAASNPGDDLLTPQRLRFRRIDRESKRTQLAGTVETKPTTDLDVALTGIYSRDQTFEDIQQQVYFLGNADSSSTVDGAKLSPYSILQTSNHTATVVSGNAVVENNRQEEWIDLRTEMVTLDGKWTPSSNWEVKGALSYAEGQSYDNQQAAIAAELLQNVKLDISNPDNPSFTSGTSLTSPSGYQPGVNLRDEYPDGSQQTQKVRKDSAQLDAKYYPDQLPIISAVQVGAKVKQEHFGQYETRVDYSSVGALPTAYQPVWGSSNGVVSNFLNGNVSMPSGWINPDIDAYKALLAKEGVSLPTEFDPTNTYDVDRNIYAAYVKGDIDTKLGSLPLRGNLGVRIEQTQQSVSGYNAVPSVNPNNTVGYDAAGNFQSTQHYFNYLPSINLTADLQPDLLLRFAAAKVLERTSLDANSSSFTTTINRSVVGGTTTYGISEGDLFLKPLTAKQADLSLEYYYGEGSGVSLAGFFKAVKNSTVTSTVCPASFGSVTLSQNASSCMGSDGAEYVITTTTNNNATINLAGTEVSWTQNLDAILPIKGFGFTTNYTYVQQYAPTDATPLHQLSKHTVNGSFYWADDQFSARLSANYRSSYYQYSYNESFYAREGHTIDGRTQLDIELGYNYDNKLSFTFTGQNINYAPLETAYDGLSSRWQETAYAGAVYTIGMTYKFF